MQSDIVGTLTATFEGHAQKTDGGIEYWLARDVQHLLGYAEWRNFTTVISKARTACEVSGHPVAHHFVDVNKMVDLGSGSQREIDDIMLTRYACYPRRRMVSRSRHSTRPSNEIAPGSHRTSCFSSRERRLVRS